MNYLASTRNLDRPQVGKLVFLARFPELHKILALLLLLFVHSCSERPPQYQMIPAILAGDIAKVEFLLEDTANVDINWKAGGDGASALSTATAVNNVEIVKLLLDRGADPNIANADNRRPLQSAAYHGYVEIARLLIEAGADVNAAETRHGFTPLTSAAHKGHADVVKLLLENGADQNARIAGGLTAFDLAYNYGHAEVLRALEASRISTQSESEMAPSLTIQKSGD